MCRRGSRTRRGSWFLFPAAGLIYRAIKRAASGPVKYWSGKDFTACDPSQWPDDMELSVNVGLGTGNKDQAIRHLGLIGNLQKGWLPVPPARCRDSVPACPESSEGTALKGLDIGTGEAQS